MITAAIIRTIPLLRLSFSGLRSGLRSWLRLNHKTIGKTEVKDK